MSKLFSVLFAFSLFLFIFSFVYNLPVDFDLGWHLRYGKETLVNKKVAIYDSFSHTFNGKPFIDSCWLTEVFFYYLFSHFSFFGFTLVISALTTLAIFLLIFIWGWPAAVQFFLAAWLVLSCSPNFKIGPRTQNFSWIFFSFLFILLLKYSKNGKKKFLLPLPIMFSIWVNSHGGFLLGLGVIAFFAFFETIACVFKPELTGKKVLSLAVVFLICLGTFFLRPFSLLENQSYFDRAKSIFDLFKGIMLPLNLATGVSRAGGLRTNIAEWLPPLFFNLSGTLFLLAIVVSIAIFTTKRINLVNIRKLALLFLFAYFGTLSRKNVPFFFLVFVPVIGEEFKSSFLLKKLKPFDLPIKILMILLMLFVSISRTQLATAKIERSEKNFKYYCQETNYPYKAIEYIKKHPPSGNMFNLYNWGGFLIWQLPEYPTFIDGRKPGGEIFSEYKQVVNLKEGWQKVLEKYQVEWMLVHNGFLFEQIVTTEASWEKVYEDEIAIILIKREAVQK